MDHVKGLASRAPVDMKLYDDPKQEEMIWKVREGGLGSTAWISRQPDTWPGWEDSAVPVEAVPQYLRKLRRCLISMTTSLRCMAISVRVAFIAACNSTFTLLQASKNTNGS